MKKIKIVELFSGIGAPRKALINLGYDVETLFISEINKKSITAYEKIFNEKTNNLGDITKIDKKSLSKYVGQCDILYFGSPCQDFSQGGKQLGGAKNTNTRSSLLWNAVKVIKIIKPKIVVFENVKNILNNYHINVVENYIEELKKSKYYSAKPFILNSKNFSVPQNRERAFVISSLDKKIINHINNIDWVTKQTKETSLEKFLKIKNFMDRNLEKEVIQNDNWTNFATWTSKNGVINGSYNRAWKIKSYCGTLNLTTIMKITDGKHVSKLTPEESWLLMGFSKNDFNKVANLFNASDLYKMAGNSIVVKVLEVISNEII